MNRIKRILSRLKQIVLRVPLYAKKLKDKIIRFFLLRYRQLMRKNKYGNSPRRVLIYNIFESGESLQKHKLLFLKALSEIADDVHIIVNGSLSESDVALLKPYGKVTLRENKGYDVAAFRQGILELGQSGLANYDQLLLVNDTNVGPFSDLESLFRRMPSDKLDFWGISLGEIQLDFTGLNPYGYIPEHVQTYFLVIEKSLLSSPSFYCYWERLDDTDSRQKAIGKHETVFTKYFSNLGFVYDAVIRDTTDSAMYIHPLRVLKEGAPLVKFSAFSNYDDDQFIWTGLERKSEVPELINYISTETDYPLEIINDIVEQFKKKSQNQYVLIIDGVENIIPQCTRYRVLNKAEQLERLGYRVKIVNHSQLELLDGKYASHIIIYRAPDSPVLTHFCQLAKLTDKTVYYDIDDLVFDTKYTDQLEYTQNLSTIEKGNYDAGVHGYGRMLAMCDVAITSTKHLALELAKYKEKVILNRNVLSKELLNISLKTLHLVSDNQKIKLAYFSGSITHNENFELIKPAIINLLKKYKHLELHLAGHLDVPADIVCFGDQIVTHPYVDWKELPQLISSIDINLAPLVDVTFNRAKSEIKWLEAAIVKVPTVASKVGSFEEMILDGQTGLLADPSQWEEKLEFLILDATARERISDNAYQFVKNHCTTQSEIKDFLLLEE